MKTCLDWEQEVAGDSESAELAEHLRACESCREFAQELEKNQTALRAIEVHPAAFDAVRRRVLGEIEGERRRTKWWSWSAVAAAAFLAVICFFYAVRRWPTPGAPTPLTARMDPPRIERTPPPVRQVAPRPRIHPRFAPDVGKATSAEKTEPLVVKMLTDDPNVIIIWLVDQKGDAL
jgi:predicted anti-sigma-YlaC factor YlaD